VISILREVHQAVEEARARGDTALDPEQLEKLRQRYDEAAAFGITHNRLRDWHDGNHPGYALGCWLQEYKEQVWLFTREFAVEWTSNSAERAVKGPKRPQPGPGHQDSSGRGRRSSAPGRAATVGTGPPRPASRTPSASRSARGTRRPGHKVRNDGAVNNGPNTASRLASEAGSGSVTSGSIAGNPGSWAVSPALVPRLTRRRRPGGTSHAAAPPGGCPPGHGHHGQHARHTPDPQTRTAITRRIIAHVTRGWPRLGEPIVRHRGQFCYVSAVLPGHREPTPILRLRYQGSAGRWATGIYRASTGQYTESELPASFGPATGTPEQGVDDTFVLYAGPESGR